ncbi:RmlC-like cupin domain-containing protein [Irpex lacteus]|nr:RmlC-like cupin domain-containing protein [Irpex lacteus]
MGTSLGTLKPTLSAKTVPRQAAAADSIIKLLDLEKHPEGGYFRRTHQEPAESPSPYADSQLRPLATSIYYFLTADSPSSLFHMNKSATVHAVHQGRAEYTLMYPGTPPRVEKVILGLDIERGEKLQLYVGSNVWKKSRLLDEDVRLAESDPSIRAHLGCLITEVVFPGFVWEDHTYLHKAELERMWRDSGDEDGWREWVGYTKD